MKKKGSPLGLLLAFVLVALGVAGEQRAAISADAAEVVSAPEDRPDSVACEAQNMGCSADVAP